MIKYFMFKNLKRKQNYQWFYNITSERLDGLSFHSYYEVEGDSVSLKYVKKYQANISFEDDII